MVGDIQYRKVSIGALDCLSSAGDLIRGNYWGYVGIGLLTFIAYELSSGFLAGPFFVGTCLCFLAREQGKEFKFERVFKGFDTILNSFIGMLIYMGISMVVLFPFMLLWIGTIMLSGSVHDGEMHGVPVIPLVCGFVLLFLLMSAIWVPFTFMFALIAEHELPGLEAFKLSARASMANFFGLYRLWLLNSFLMFLGLCMCVVPLILLMPHHMASYMVAYRKVFGEPSKASPEEAPSGSVG